MNINTTLEAIINGDTTQPYYDEVKRYSGAYLNKSKAFNYKPFEVEDIVSTALLRLYTRKDQFNATKAKPITWYTTIIFNEAALYHREKEKNHTYDYIDIENKDGEDDIQFQFEDLLDEDTLDQQLLSEEVRLYIEENFEMLHYYLYSQVYSPSIYGDKYGKHYYSKDGVTYKDLAEKYNISVNTAAGRIFHMKDKVIFHFTGKSKSREHRKDRYLKSKKRV